MSHGYDAVVVGSGPNGLSAAIALARAGAGVLVVEARAVAGGGLRTAELTRPGFAHDVCSAVHPLAVASPFLSRLRLESHGLTWIEPELALAHALDDGQAVALDRSLAGTVARLGPEGPAWQRLLGPLVADWPRLAPRLLGPPSWPRPFGPLARFGLQALRSAEALAASRLAGPRSRALFAGLAAHSFLPLDAPATAAFGLVLGVLGHRTGWPFPRGGAARLAEALVAALSAHGGELVTGRDVRGLADLPPARVVLLDVTPRQALALCGDRLPAAYRRRLGRYRYGPGVCKLDLALAGPIPWRAADCHRAGTVHLGGSFAEVAAAERAVWRGEHPEQPFVLLAQPTRFDPGRAPAGGHVAWAYCHVPNGSRRSRAAAIEARIERFAPGFADLVLARAERTTERMEADNANLVGGDINGGLQDLRQILARPVLALDPYATPDPGLFLCSSSTPPGGGVHGMCGYHAARSAARRLGLTVEGTDWPLRP